MTEDFSRDRWNVFENSGRVADYLYYEGIGSRELPTSRSAGGEPSDAHNHCRSGDISKGRGG